MPSRAKQIFRQGSNKGFETVNQPGLVDREDERKGHASKAPCLIPAATFRKAILNSLAPFGTGVNVIAPLPERLLGLIEGPLRPQSSFEYMCLVVISLWPSPLEG